MLKVKPINNRREWEKFVLSIKPNTFLQSWNWGEFHAKLGQTIWRVGFWKGKDLVGVSLVVRENAKRGRYLACPGGPLWVKGVGDQVKEAFCDWVHRTARKERALFVRIRPSEANSALARTSWRKLGFIRAPMHMHAETTWRLNLTQTEAEILAGMRKTTRQCLRRAEADGVKIVKTKNCKAIDSLYRLQLETAHRQRFVPFSKKFWRVQFSQFVKDNQTLIIQARYKGELLAASMFLVYGDTAVYHYSGSVRTHPHVYASHLIQWAAIQEAKKRGCEWYNFWGIAPDDNPKHRFAGVTTFKKGFGGERFDWVPAHDLPVSWRYWLVWFFETGRRKARSL